MQPPKHAKYIDIPYYIWYETKSKVVLGGAAFLAKGLYIYIYLFFIQQQIKNMRLSLECTPVYGGDHLHLRRVRL